MKFNFKPIRISHHCLYPEIVTGLLIIFFLGTGCGSSEQTRTLKLAHSLSREHSVHQGMVYMADTLEKISDGRISIKIYPSGQLGAERELLELLQIGSLSMTKVSAAVMEGFSEKYKVLGLPYIFKSEEHSYKVLDGKIGQEILLSGEKYGLRGLGFYDAGARNFYTIEEPVLEPADLQGKKIRVMKSNTAMQMISEMGGSPTPISWGELYTALQSGVVDGAENNLPSFYLSRHYEVCNYYSFDQHTRIPDVLLMSKVVWDKLTGEERAWIQQAADASIQYQRKLWDKSEQEALDAIKEAGVEIKHPDKAPFRDKVADVYEFYKSNEQLKPLIEEIQSME